ncbi:MAG: hypothetical protein M1812_004119 [Candelaria pacifica]|nr:MAG: hypothetical protein M1812_004119 [Candelaria pacifica]
MSFNAKNLNYDMKEPSFLRKLKSEYGSGDSHRHERPVARPRKHQTEEGEDDDRPTYVDEETNEIISEGQYHDLVGKPLTDEATDKGGTKITTLPTVSIVEDGATEESKSVALKQKVTEIGSRKKRKAVKVIDDEAGDLPQAKATPKPERNVTDQAIEKRKSKRRAGGSVKLSFDD